MRLRQFVVAAADRTAAVAQLRDVLGLEVAYEDPGVAAFGLVNALLPVGDAFLEVVSPVTDDAPARRFLARHGDGGYMIMVQVEEMDAARRRCADLGVRIVWQADLPAIRGTHLHPADVGGAILSLDEAHPPASWAWAGGEWRRHVRTERVTGLVGADLAGPDPEGMARRWAAVFDRPVARERAGAWEIRLGDTVLRFEPGKGPARVAGCVLAARDAAAVLDAARARGLPAGADAVWLAGTRVRLVAAP